jgi:hypothetical protein
MLPSRACILQSRRRQPDAGLQPLLGSRTRLVADRALQAQVESVCAQLSDLLLDTRYKALHARLSDSRRSVFPQFDPREGNQPG